MSMKFFVERSDFRMRADFFIMSQDSRYSDGAKMAVKPLVFETVPLEEHRSGYDAPAFSLEHPDAQHLFQEMWNAGFRPREQGNTADMVEALRYHLSDMRHIAFKGKPPCS